MITQYPNATILTGQVANAPGTYQDVNTVNNALAVNQLTTLDTGNSSTVNLAAGATFVGTWTADIPYSGAQYTLKSDQNCIVYIEQSPDGTNADISDAFNYYASLGGSGQTVQLVSSFYRIRVTNVGTATTTVFRLQTLGVPLINPLPRSLNMDGNLKVAVQDTADDSGFVNYHTPEGEQVAVPVYRLLGKVFSSSALDTNNWIASIGTGGTVAESGGQVTLSTGTTANNTTSLNSAHLARYVSGQINVFRTVFNLGDTGVANNTRRGGAFTPTTGAFFQLSGTTFSIVTRAGGVDTVVNNGSFNGKYGGTVTLDTNVHTWEIKYTPKGVWFFIDNKLFHTVTANSTTWYSDIHVPVRFENFNSGGSTTNVSMSIRSAAIFKLGIPQTQPIGYFQQGLTAGVQVKLGAGSLHGITMSGVTNNSVVTLYDGTSTAGAVIWSTGAMTNNTFPFDIPMSGISFDNGLFLAITGAASNALVKYE